MPITVLRMGFKQLQTIQKMLCQFISKPNKNFTKSEMIRTIRHALIFLNLGISSAGGGPIIGIAMPGPPPPMGITMASV